MQQSAARFLNAAGGALIWFFMRSGQPADGGGGAARRFRSPHDLRFLPMQSVRSVQSA